MADETEIHEQITALIQEEHLLREDAAGPLAERRARLRALEAQLDQCWDLLRQRAARREHHQNPDNAHVRAARVVENYEN